jgi:hypothetical protein
MRYVFYSWQSDLPNSTNRGFIEKALEGASRSIRHDSTIKVEPVVDRDTVGVPGSPDIVRTIFEKIDRADVIVCDVSIINNGERRPTPNPNVLIELGYAIKSLGWQRIIMVMNTAFGEPDKLPFDLRTHKCLTYHTPGDAENRASERQKLQNRLEGQLREVFSEPEREFDVDPNRLSRAQLDLLDMINTGKGSFTPADFYSDANSIDSIRKFQVQANELIRLQETGYIRKILPSKDSFGGQLYLAQVIIVEGLTAEGFAALRRR